MLCQKEVCENGRKKNIGMRITKKDFFYKILKTVKVYIVAFYPPSMNGVYMSMVAIALIAIIIGAGLYYYPQGEQNTKLEVKEGYAKLICNVTNLTTYKEVDKTVTAITIINNGIGVINFTLRMASCAPAGRSLLLVPFNISSQVLLPSNLTPSDFKIQVQELENSHSSYDFQLTSLMDLSNACSNMSVWNDNNVIGAWAPHTAYIGFTPYNSKFGINDIDLEWTIHDPRNINIHTLRLEAICDIHSEKISATVDIVIDTSQIMEVSK